jgi:hypothetical protein
VIVRASLRPVAALLLLAACMIGTTGRSYAPAKGPAGATVSLDVTGKRAVSGELLAVEETTLLVLQERQLIRVAVTLIESGKAPKISFTRQSLAGATRERLRLISRYPQGVSPELEARLVEAYGVTSVREIS